MRHSARVLAAALALAPALAGAAVVPTAASASARAEVSGAAAKHFVGRYKGYGTCNEAGQAVVIHSSKYDDYGCYHAGGKYYDLWVW